MNRGRTTLLLVVLVSCLLPTLLGAQDQPSAGSSAAASAAGDRGSSQTPSSSDSIDSLFNSGSGTTSGTPPANGAVPAGPPTPPAVRPDDITRDNKVHFIASLDIYGLLGLGYGQLPNSSELSSGIGGEEAGSLSASLGMDVRPAPQLRLRSTLSYNFPTAGTQLSQLIIDYSVRDAVFFNLGIFDYAWGISQFFQFANLPARGLPGWSGVINEPLWQKTNILSTTVVTNYPATVRMYIPFGVNGVTLLTRFDMANYGFPSATTPDPRYAGYGAQLNLVTGPIEWTLAGFFQKLLNTRTSLSMKTSVLGFDLSAETTVALPGSLGFSGFEPFSTAGGGIYVGGTLQRIYPTVTLGLFREWQDPHIRLYVEYGFNGERDPGVSWLADETGPGGHNSVVALRYANVNGSGVSLNAVWQQNWSDWSGLISTFLEVSPVEFTTIQLGPVFLYGPANGEVVSNRLVPGGKSLELLLLVKVSDSFRN